MLIGRTSRGEELPWDDVFSLLHQNANETGTFVDNKSKTVVLSFFFLMYLKYHFIFKLIYFYMYLSVCRKIIIEMR